MDIIFGGTAAVTAGMFSNPLDVVKIRMQLQGELKRPGHYVVHYRSLGQAMYMIARTDGVRALQKGLVPVVWSQFLLNGCKLGIYQIGDTYGLTLDVNGEKQLHKRVILGTVAAAIGALLTSPFYMIKTHLQAQANKSIAVGHQHKHQGFRDAISVIYSQHGLRGLWRGVEAHVFRTGISGAVQVVTFGLVKDYIDNLDTLRNMSLLQKSILASTVSGVAMSLAITPLDLISTRLYNQGVNKNTGEGLFYKGYLDCATKTFEYEGLKPFYKGIGLNYLKLGPHTILTLVIWDQLKSVHKQFKEFKYNKGNVV